MTNFSLRLQKLSEQFRRDLELVRTDLKDAYVACKERPEPENLENFRRIVHKLAGSGATFGYPTISHAALELERSLEHLSETEGPRPHEIRNAYEKLQNTILTTQSQAPLAISETSMEAPLQILCLIEKSDTKGDILETLAAVSDLHGSRPFIQTVKSQGEALQLCRESRFDAIIVVASSRIPEVFFRDLAETQCLEGGITNQQPPPPFVYVLSENIPKPSFCERLELARYCVTDLLVSPLKIRELEATLSLVLHSPERNNYRVMMLDDDEDLLGYYAAGLESMGVSLRTLSSIENLSDEIEDFMPELLIIDVHLGILNGFEVARALRQDPKEGSIPVVFMSTDPAAESNRFEGRQDQADFLVKPITATALLRSILPHLQASRRQHDLLEGYESALRKLESATEQASAAKDHMARFLANMTHEIRNPLNGILGMARLLSKTSLSKNQEEYVTLLERAGSSLVGLANNVLDHSKLQAGKIELERDWTSLASIGKDLESFFAGPATENNTILIRDWRLHEDELFLCDSQRIFQILTNLVGNAVKFTRNGTVFLRAFSKPDADRAILHFQVLDSGPGIPEHERLTLFDAFEQGSLNSKDAAGTGLGLAIASQLVLLMHSEIKLESEVGHGSRFHFQISCPFRAHSPSEGSAEAEGTADFPYELQFDSSFSEREQALISLALLGDRPGAHGLTSKPPKRRGGDSQSSVYVTKSALGKIGPLSRRGLCAVLRLSPDQGPFNITKLRKHPLHFDAARPQASKDRHRMNTRDRKAASERLRALPARLQVLVAEDEAINQTYIEALLKHLGVECQIVSNGKHAVEAFENRSFDTVILDSRMPVMGGIEAAKVIRSLDSQVPIIAITAETDWEQKSLCLKAGVNEVITKPVVEKSLFAILNKHLNLKTNTEKKEDERSQRKSLVAQAHIEDLLSIQDANSNSLFDTLFTLWPQLVRDFRAVCLSGRKVTSHEDIFQAAHRLKGASGNMGAEGLQDLCEGLEQAAKNRDNERIEALLADFDDLEKETTAQLASYCASFQKSG